MDQGRFNHLTATVGFGDNAVGAALVIEADRLCRPFDWRHYPGYVIKDVTMSVDAEGGADDSAFVRVFLKLLPAKP